jgi:NIMA (never in mitosis gene a)-related kinase/serine/threonine-protein kinase
MYVISDFLGRGSFGEVYRANGESTGTVVAVKLLPLGKLSGEVEKRALLNEIKAAQQINHPNVVRVLHVDEGSIADLGPYACMEYVSGGTLDRLLSVKSQASSQIPLSRAIEMMIDIAQGMRAVNERVVHRDVKPDNILIEGKTLKISDFGISKFIDESTRLHTFKGGQHAAYMAPEGWATEKNTHKLDVYAVGIVFFQILTLQHPLLPKVKDPGNFTQWESAHLFETCPDVRTGRSDVPISLAQLVSRMVAKRPQDRPEWEEVLMKAPLWIVPCLFLG